MFIFCVFLLLPLNNHLQRSGIDNHQQEHCDVIHATPCFHSAALKEISDRGTKRRRR